MTTKRKMPLKATEVTPRPDYSFCETATAPPLGKWHLRRLTSNGFKFSGGADTASLCGRNVAWDLDVAISFGHLLSSTCEQCKAHYLAETDVELGGEGFTSYYEGF